MQKRGKRVESIQPQQVRQHLDGARVNTNITSAREATKMLGLVVPSGVRLIKSEPWLTHLDVG
jgi:hypothetical protein